MIISCENCNKKFEADDNLIPNTGRLLQCGSCKYKWHFKPIKNTPSIEKIENITKNNKDIKKDIKKKVTISITPAKPLFDVDEETEDKNTFSKNSQKRKKSFFHLFLAFIISFIALIVLIDTFKANIYTFFPNIDFYLNSLYETLEDIFLFIKDLIN